MSPAEFRAVVAEYREANDAIDIAKATVTAAQVRLKQAREELEQAVVEMAIDGTRMRDLVTETGLSREWIRQLLRRNNVTPEE